MIRNLALKAPIKITDKAASHIIKICKESKYSYLYFYASGGGCGGFKYNLKPINKPENIKDTLVHHKGASVYVDRMSELHVLGTTIDYEEKNYSKGIIDEGFKYIPEKDFATMCGCGISFSPKI